LRLYIKVAEFVLFAIMSVLKLAEVWAVQIASITTCVETAYGISDC
jgi:hypothetical protein